MALAPGTRLGPYSVTAKIGEGGMGEVYQARDTKLDRDVALKVLPDAFTADPDRAARFEREAKVLASLNHPNIGGIHGLEDAEGTKALVLELVEGPTLADRIRQGPIPLDEALPIATQIADALEAAHEAGVIHRDLKPANIKVTPDGTVKVLDFGLAKALDPAPEGDPAQSPTLTAAATQMGVVLGTAAYMSPEQARGKAVDKRADIWAFGVVLYEMLAGARPFQGEDVSLTLASVMKSDVDTRTLPDDVPPAVRTVLDRCLDKDPRQRMRDIGDVRLALEGRFETATGPPAETAKAGSLVAPWQRPISIVAMVLTAAALTAVALSSWPEAPAARADLVRFVVTPPDTAPLGFSRFDKDVALSADGTLMVYSSVTADGQQTLLTAHRLDELDGVPLRGTEGSVAPFISPDGQWVGFVDNNTEGLRRVSVLGGPPQTLAELPTTLESQLVGTASSWAGASWGADDLIIAGTFGGGLFRVPLDGGLPEALTEPDRDAGETGHNRPSIIPGYDAVLFNLRGTTDGELAVLDLTTREVTRLGLEGHTAHYVSSGHLVYAVEDGSIRAVPFDASSLTVTGAPAPLIEGVASKGSGAANFSLSTDGRLIYVPGLVTVANRQQNLAWLDHDGNPEPIPFPTDSYRQARLSPSGDQVLLAVSRRGETRHLWVSELTRNTLTRVTTDPDGGTWGTWLTDDRILFDSDRDGIPGIELYVRSADGTGAESLALVTDAETVGYQGKALGAERVVVTFGDAEKVDVGLLTLGDEPSLQPLVESESSKAYGTVSPDGGWLAYSSRETGVNEVYVERFPAGGERQRISSDGGAKPLWAPGGGTLYYVSANRVMRTNVDAGRSFTAETPTELFQVRAPLDERAQGIQDLSPDGQRFLALVPPGGIDAPAEATAGITVVLNWQQELLERVPIP